MDRQKKQAVLKVFWRDAFITVLVLAVVTAVAFFLLTPGGNNGFVPILFVTAVFLIARLTTGYFFGILSSVLGVVLVNFIFTAPYFKFDFTIAGYPVTFISMLATSVMTSAMTTQIKQEEKIRLEAEKEKIRGNLLRAISHDLRTPLTSIIGSISALLDNEGRLSAAQQRQLLSESREEAQGLVRMVENLLSVTRMNGEDAHIDKIPEAVEEVVSESVRKFQKRFAAAEVSVKVPSQLLLVPMDAMLIEQVLINLLENAVLHGGKNNSISLKVTGLPEQAVFEVADCGQGISAEAMAHLFDGYRTGKQLSEPDNRRNMGIGLSVCQSIIMLHGGKLTACNKPEGGACFRFTLPLKG